MKTTPEQRAALRRLCTSNEGEALPGDTEAAAGASEDVTLDLLDDLDEALAEVAAMRYGLDGAMECIRRARQAMAEKVDTDVVLAVRRVVAELAALRVVAEAARGLLRLERPFYCDCDTLSAGPCAPCRRANALRAAGRAPSAPPYARGRSASDEC